tara:strand:+ start:457 stop:792 length:336 start_codon:yes stop_codon:yes gene_type:complete
MDCYWQALERLVNNTPQIIPLNSKINNDNVALEAGKGKGAIKKSRSQFDLLRQAILDESEKQKLASPSESIRIKALKEELEYYKGLYHESINRELILLEKLKADCPNNLEH